MSWIRPWTMAAVLWTATVAWLMLLPSSSMESAVSGWPALLEVPGLDKILHAGSFGLLAWLWIGARAEGWGERASPTRRWLLPLLATIGYGVFLEGIQSLLPTRATQWGDILANSFGALAVAALSGFRQAAARARSCPR